MALMECYECEVEISDKALSCPHCGAPNKKAIEQQGIKQKGDVKKLENTLTLLCIGALIIPLCGIVAIVISIIMLLDGRGGLGNLLASIFWTGIGSAIWVVSMS